MNKKNTNIVKRMSAQNKIYATLQIWRCTLSRGRRWRKPHPFSRSMETASGASIIVTERCIIIVLAIVTLGSRVSFLYNITRVLSQLA